MWQKKKKRINSLDKIVCDILPEVISQPVRIWPPISHTHWLWLCVIVVEKNNSATWVSSFF